MWVHCLCLSPFPIFSTQYASLPTPFPGKGLLRFEGRMCFPTVFRAKTAHQELEKIIVLVHTDAKFRTEYKTKPLSYADAFRLLRKTDIFLWCLRLTSALVESRSNFKKMTGFKLDVVYLQIQFRGYRILLFLDRAG